MAKQQGVPTRRLALRALKRIESDGAYANLVLGPMLADSQLSERDRGLVTELVYGTTRMRRACDYVVDRFVLGSVDAEIRSALRMGAYQMVFMGTAPHAAVHATVGAVKGRGGSMVNAVLRKVAASLDELEWPDDSTRLSYPNWIVQTLMSELGPEKATSALEAMNKPAAVNQRADGYIQDQASMAVVEAVDGNEAMLIADLCAAPGGKATGLAATGASVIAGDSSQSRIGLVAENVERLNSQVSLVVADGRHPPLRRGVFDAVLIDAPCSGLGSLRRRPDARWRIDAAAPARLAVLQVELVRAALELVKPAGRVIYSVCTLTRVESDGVLESLGSEVVVHERVLSLPGESDGMFTAVLGRA